MVDLQQQDELDRSLKVPISDNSGASFTLPSPVAEKLFRWNAAGTALEMVSISDLSLGLGSAFKFSFDTSTSMADPGTGDVRFNNATLASVTAIAFSNKSNQSGNPDISDFLATLGASDSTVKSHLTLFQDGTPSNFVVFTLDAAVTDNTDWLQCTVTHVDSGGSFSASDSLVLMFSRTGDKGDTGATGATGSAGVNASLDYQFESTTTDADQGAGKLWLNNATVASATVLYLDDDDDNGNDVSAFTAQWDDAADGDGIRGTIFVKSKASPSTDYAVFNITGATTDATAYQKFAVTHVMSFGTFSDTEELTVEFIQGAGDTSVGKHTIFIPASAMRATTSNGAAAINDVETTAGRPDITAFDFDATADEHVQFQVAMPKSWNLGTVTAQFFWESTATDTDGVTWAIQGVACADSDTIDVAYGTAVTVDDANISAAEDLYVTAESGAITIAGSPGNDELAFFRVFRDVSDANDTATEDARLIGVKLFFTTDEGEDS